ncbi:RAF proto-oncogene serine/threonine-protein kinase isoform X2 [Asparagus officinalis]|uniref:RAF proto-oncogene serine/threonine-protein kinase isoform X2 n=1 Tax=Asparagus officinalis TaxID=4686 RepID=UPI00098E7D4F|nr:RAF proto-oncogene serine/threonine-protein kinase isoform X2 [Asparagus officinalis]
MGELSEGGLLRRFRDLEVSQEKLREQLGLVLREGTDREREDTKRNRDEYDAEVIPGSFSHPYRSVLQHIGHAVHVCRYDTGEIIYWNQAAENLYGWRDHEALGQTIANLLINPENHQTFEWIMEKLSRGQKWSGRFPFRKRSGHMFMAMVTKSPLYENNELIGIITVSLDSAILDDMNKEKSRMYWNESHGVQGEQKPNFGSLRPQTDIVSSVSNLASKFLPRIHAYSNDEIKNSWERCGFGLETENLQSEKPRIMSASSTIFKLQSGLKAIEEKTYKYEEILAKFNQQSKIAAKVFSKLHPGRDTPKFTESDKGVQNNSINILKEDSPPPIPQGDCTGSCRNRSHMSKENYCEAKQVPGHAEQYCAPNSLTIPKDIAKDEMKRNYNECIHCSERGFRKNGKNKAERASRNLANCSSNTVETDGSSQTGISLVGKKDLNLITKCDIRWEDLRVGEEVGQGSYAVVYRGVWNGSDVAIKVYTGNDYQEGLLLEYKKEIAIMKRLRHPNVLLFMGAVYSRERHAIVTEFLPRGSLFKTLHKNNQKLDMKRRLRMALDVARGMNYLHRRNPPIVHRDLKSSNLLVDKNWTVKVGDFGLSCLKISTVLTTTSGKGTPQWMAPEVLRGDWSNEKSDVFSFGVVLWELMTESVPWSQLSPLQVIGVVGIMDRRLDLPPNMDPRVSSIICDCWDSDPRRRPSFEQLVGRMGELITAVTPALAHRRSEHPTGGSAALDDC